MAGGRGIRPRRRRARGDGWGSLSFGRRRCLRHPVRRRRRRANALNVEIRPPGRRDAVGAPKLTLAYAGTGTRGGRLRPDRRHRAQDRARQPGDADPDRARRQGPHRSARARGRSPQPSTPALELPLQIIGGTQVYGPARTTASDAPSAARTSSCRPSAASGSAPSRPRGGLLPTSRTLRVTAPLHHPPAPARRQAAALERRCGSTAGGSRSGGSHGRLQSRASTCADRGSITRRWSGSGCDAVTRGGKVVKETRRYRTCATAPPPPLAILEALAGALDRLEGVLARSTSRRP